MFFRYTQQQRIRMYFSPASFPQTYSLILLVPVVKEKILI